jgi:hypothetical protein
MNMVRYVSVNVTNMTLTINWPTDCDVIIRAYEFQIIQIEFVMSLTTSDNLKGKINWKLKQMVRLGLHWIMLSIMWSKFVYWVVILTGVAQSLDVIQQGQKTYDACPLSTHPATGFINNSDLVRIKSNNHLSLTILRMRVRILILWKPIIVLVETFLIFSSWTSV